MGKKHENSWILCLAKGTLDQHRQCDYRLCRTAFAPTSQGWNHDSNDHTCIAYLVCRLHNTKFLSALAAPLLLPKCEPMEDNPGRYEILKCVAVRMAAWHCALQWRQSLVVQHLRELSETSWQNKWQIKLALQKHHRRKYEIWITLNKYERTKKQCKTAQLVVIWHKLWWFVFRPT